MYIAVDQVKNTPPTTLALLILTIDLSTITYTPYYWGIYVLVTIHNCYQQARQSLYRNEKNNYNINLKYSC